MAADMDNPLFHEGIVIRCKGIVGQVHLAGVAHLGDMMGEHQQRPFFQCKIACAKETGATPEEAHLPACCRKISAYISYQKSVSALESNGGAIRRSAKVFVLKEVGFNLHAFWGKQDRL